jgi:hypothetical protein
VQLFLSKGFPKGVIVLQPTCFRGVWLIAHEERAMNLLSRVNFPACADVGPNQKSSSAYQDRNVAKTYLYVVCFPSSRLVNVSRLMGRISSSHQCHVRDSCIWICSSGVRSRLNRDVRRPTTPAWYTIHRRGGLLRSKLKFLALPPPLNQKKSKYKT